MPILRNFLVDLTAVAIAATLAACAPAPRGVETVTAFTNVSLVPMTDETIVEQQTVLVRGARIAAVGPSNAIAVPDDATVIDGAGAYLMPGLADMHMHTREDWHSDTWPVSPLKLYLANGVTTIRDFGPRGDPLTYVIRWRDRISKGQLIGPTIYATGLRPGHPTAGDADPWEIVRKNKDHGFDFLKIYSFLSRADFQTAIDSARKLNMYTAGHIPFAVGLDGVLEAGMDEIAHIEELDFEFIDFDRSANLQPRAWFNLILERAAQQYQDAVGLDMDALEERYGHMYSGTIEKLSAADIPVCTTLVVGEVIVEKLSRPQAFLARLENRYLPKWYVNVFQQGKEKHQVQFKGHEDVASLKYSFDKILSRELKRAGVRLVLATDSGTGSMGIVPGFSIHDELRILTENGFTPYEAITTGTVHASQIAAEMTGEDSFGTIEVDKRADLILVNENPLENVSNIRNLRGVMAAGRWYVRTTLEQMIAVPR